VEEAALAAVASTARHEGATRLVGDYIPSPKNQMAADHFPRLGFSLACDLPEGGSRWVLDLSAYRPPRLPMRVIIGDGLMSDAA
jgi:predicted enzyme involved in methoxymalonyl-ACP biosynthesis